MHCIRYVGTHDEVKQLHGQTDVPCLFSLKNQKALNQATRNQCTTGQAFAALKQRLQVGPLESLAHRQIHNFQSDEAIPDDEQRNLANPGSVSFG